MIFEQIYKTERERLVESYVYKDPLFEQWQKVGRIIAERKMTEPEILDLFGKIETGLTNKDTGANRTWMGRGKDVTTKAFTNTKDAFNSVMSSIQNSAPVQAVDVAYDQATDAVANLTGGQQTKVMQAIKGYRNLVKEYPKAAGFAKAALVAIAGLATGGAGLPAIAGLTYALDSAIRGDKLSSVLGKGAGAAAVTWGGQQAFGALKGTTPDGVTVPADQSIVPGETIVGPDDQINLPDKYANVPSRFDEIVNNAIDYKVKQGDTLSEILADRKINPEAFRRLPGNDVFFSPDGNPNILKAGQTIKLPDPADVLDLNKMSGTTPSDPNLAKGYGDTNFYTGQYNQNSAYGLDAKNNLQRQDFGRWGSDNGMAAARVAQDAGGQAVNPGPTNLGPNFNPDNIPPGWTMKQAPSPIDATAGRIERYIPQPDGSWIDASTGKVADPAKIQADQASVRNALRTGFRESINFKTLPAEKLFDDKLTVMSWALNESVGKPQGQSVHLTTLGVYTVFENVNRYARAVVKEAVGPGRPDLPDEFRPDMPGGAGGYDKSKKGIVGKGLDWLDRATGKVGGALSKFGHQFTTKVTKEKLKMDWHQAGKPSDSDAIAAFLAKQGVPQNVIGDVYGSMGIPAPAPTPAPTPAPVQGQTNKGGAQTQLPYYGINPDTKKPWTVDELQAKAAATKQTPPVNTTTTTTPSTGGATFNASNVMQMPGMQKYAKTAPAAPAKTANFGAGPTGYSKTTTTFKAPAAPNAPTAPTVPTVTAGSGGTYNPKTGAAKIDGKSAVALKDLPADIQKQLQPQLEATKKQVSKMLESVQTKSDVDRIKKYVDQQFATIGLTENTVQYRKKLMDHITHVGSIRRRMHASSVGN
jgi:hypothetical protein